VKSGSVSCAQLSAQAIYSFGKTQVIRTCVVVDKKKMSHNIPQAITQHRQLLYTLGISWSFGLAFWNWS